MVAHLLVGTGADAHAPATTPVLVDKRDTVLLTLVDGPRRTGSNAGRIEAVVAQTRQIHMEGVFELGVHLLLYPDIVLLDLDMKDMNGIETLKKIKAADLDSRVIVLTVSDSEEDVVSALCAGAEGYLLKDMEPEDLLENMKMLPKDTWSSATG